MAVSFIPITFPSNYQFSCHFSSDMAQVEAPIYFKNHIFKSANVFVSHCAGTVGKWGSSLLTVMFRITVEAHSAHVGAVTEVRAGPTSSGTPWKHCFTQQQLTAILVRNLPQVHLPLTSSSTLRWCDWLLGFFLHTALPWGINDPIQSATCLWHPHSPFS